MILLIVAHHLIVHGGTFPYSDASASQHMFAALLEAGGKIGVDGFVLISGYFLCTATSVDPRKVVRLLIQMLTYSIAITTMFLILHPSSLNGLAASQIVLHAVFPVGFSVWWFASVYVLLLLLSPILNMAVHAMNIRQYQWLLIGGFVYLSVLPAYFAQEWTRSNLLWFIYLYAIAGYARVHRPKILDHPRIAGLLGIASLALSAGIVVLAALHPPPTSVTRYVVIDARQENPLVLLSAILLFSFFLGLRLGTVTTINTVASAAFGVYLIHDHPYVRAWLWGDVVRPADHYADGTNFYLLAVGTVLAIYVSCTLIDLVRQRLIERPLRHLVDKFPWRSASSARRLTSGQEVTNDGISEEPAPQSQN